MGLTRRQVLESGRKLGLGVALLPLGGLGGLGSGGCGDAHRCVDPQRLSVAQQSLRESLHFTESSPHGAERECGGCRFFDSKPGAEETGCGSCQILLGPANARGHCDSWAPRPAARRDAETRSSVG